MAGNDVNPDARAFIEAIEEAEKRANKYAGFVKRLKGRLSRAKKALAAKPAVASEVCKLVSDLRGMPTEPECVSSSQLIQVLEQRLHQLQTQRRESFLGNLRQACNAAQLEFINLPDGFGVGPFNIGLDWTKETASYQYARLDVLKNVALNPKAIAQQAASLKAAVIDLPVDPKQFRDELHEAMRVALARQNRLTRTELRAELPLVYQEMALIRQPGGRKRRIQAAEYTVPRFVVELKRFIQSDQNMNSDHQFRLETAVIENTKNPKKSLFIPRDLGRGYGEGTYFQAIVFA